MILSRLARCTLVWMSLGAGLHASSGAETPAASNQQKGQVMTMHAAGTFDVKNSPLAADDATACTSIGRFALDKQYHGDLDGEGKGEMLGAGNLAAGAAGYVATEQVTGTLHGRKGTFALQHFGSMQQGKFDLNVKIVPGSGAGELADITGQMTITITAGKHSYALDYALPTAPQVVPQPSH